MRMYKFLGKYAAINIVEYVITELKPDGKDESITGIAFATS